MAEEKKEISVREWQKKYRAGEFNNPSVDTMVAAGWFDWFCSGRALLGRMKKLAPLILAITDPNILDNYYVFFKNNCPCGPLYDDIRFDTLDSSREGCYFVITRKDEREKQLWTLYTERNGYDYPEAGFDNVRDAAAYLNANAYSLWNKTPATDPDWATA